MSDQLQFTPSQHSADEILRDRLACAVEEFNACPGDPERRVELHVEIVQLRRLMMRRRGSEVLCG